MLTPDQIDALREQAAKITEPIAEYLLRDIVQRIAHAGQITSTVAYQIWHAQLIGVSQQEIKKRLMKLLNLSRQEIRRIMYQSAQSGYSLDVSRFPQIQAVPFSKNTVLQQIVSAAAELAEDDFTNLTAEKLRTDRAKLTVLRQRYEEFTKDAGLRTQYERTEVAGFGGKGSLANSTQSGIIGPNSLGGDTRSEKDGCVRTSTI